MPRLALLLTVLIIFVMSPIVFASDYTVVVNGAILDTEESPPLLVDGRLLVPLRSIFTALGARVEWIGHVSTVLGLGDGRIVILGVGDPEAEVYECSEAMCASHPVILDVPAQIHSGRTMVPLRFISEALGAVVNYDGPTRTATVTGSSPAPVPAPSQFESLYQQLTQAGITHPGTTPPNVDLYTFGDGPPGVAVTSARTLQTLRLDGEYEDPSGGHDWLLVRVSVYNNGTTILDVSESRFMIIAGGSAHSLHPLQAKVEDRFGSPRLAPGATAGGVLLYAVPRALPSCYLTYSSPTTEVSVRIEL